MVVAGGSSGHDGTGGTSTKRSGGEDGVSATVAWATAHCFRRSLQLTRNPFATWDRGNIVVSATACCHRRGGIRSARLARALRQRSNWVTNWANCSSAWGLCVRFISISKAEACSEILYVKTDAFRTQAYRKLTVSRANSGRT